MKQLAELVPIILFFVIYKMDGYQLDLGSIHYQFDGIYTATAALMAATTLQVAIARLTTGRLEKRQLWLLVAVLAFGGATIALHNELFIQWKPTIFNWVMGLVFLGSQFIGEKNLMARTLGNQVSAPYPVWTRLNYLWSAYFFVVGALNLVVAYAASEAFWVSYKLYSAIGFTLALSAVSVAMLAPHIKETEIDNTEAQ
jgi:intracellular septation protein